MKKIKSTFGILLSGLVLFTSCDKSDNEVQASSTTVLYATNNSNGDVTAYDMSSGMAKSTSYATNSTAADGVYFDGTTNIVLQASRSQKGIEGFSAKSSDIGLNLGEILNVSLQIDGPKDMESPREMAVSGNFYVVADNADVDKNAATPDGRLFVYQRNGNGLTLRNIITTDFKLWGITFIGNDLYAVVDADNELAVYTNFLSNSSNATMSATKRIEIEGIVRTHGLDYNSQTDTMVMTDIGDAANTQSDGGFHMISNFKSKFDKTSAGGKLSLSEQVRVSGSMTNMGNPVDVAYDGESKTVYIAEAGNGKILAFSNIGTSGGNMTPTLSNNMAAASAVYLYKK
ncbi:hypothetical protein SAMN06298216_2105 [Spirosomataceae bacterium TFI 002]|nr:hypothetical protein SAMN06298216_2105 [Spirosomataceae bacterium TFI 002]